jgi:CMP-N,N'-diacetyllegionaminic acid synthase
MLEDPKTYRKHGNTKREQLKMKKHKVLALITARGGSKGLPGKNLLTVDGKPLLAWTIEAAHQSKIIDDVVLSSDDDQIIKTAEKWGCNAPFKRPRELATDTAKSIDVVLHALEQLPNYEYIVLLQPTSPLRTAEHIDEAFKLMTNNASNSCVSVCLAEQSPYLMYQLNTNNQLTPIMSASNQLTRRQDFPSVYLLNGAIYIGKVNFVKENKGFIDSNTTAYPMSKTESLDIDSIDDLNKFKAHIEYTRMNAK